MVGAIDLGTNTFQLLIAAPSESGDFEVVQRLSEAVFLAEDGSERIGTAPFARAQAALVKFKTTLDSYPITQLKIVGTAALRKAENTHELVNWAAQTLDLQIDIISGIREAELIYNGARLCANMKADEKYLLFDIGGGSIEFIICDNEQIFWAQSFPIGMMVLQARFWHSEPISNANEQLLYAFLGEVLQPLFDNLARHKISGVIDTFGKFDEMMGLRKTDTHFAFISAEEFDNLYKQLRYSTLADRMAMDMIKPVLKKIIIVPLLIWQFMFDAFAITRLQTVDYALKEGLADELLRQANE